MPKPLIIVESFAKVKTLSGFLRGEYDVLASGGHVRDLPEDKLGVNIQAGFQPDYYLLPGREKTVKKIAEAVARTRNSKPETRNSNGLPVLLATDPDREGEAIAWHLSEALQLNGARRIEFNEITRPAVLAALEQPRPIDMNRVNAQQARRIIDRIVGYYLSPLLWKSAGAGLSAGRVQSVALRMVCEREREIEAFIPEEYWTITAVLRPEGSEETFEAELLTVRGEKPELKNEQAARNVVAALEDADFRVAEVEVKEESRHPRPPFITSTLQQAAWYRLRLSSFRTMRLAQELYQGVKLGPEGTIALVTYIRTDSVRVASQALQAARRFIQENFGDKFLPEYPRQYRVKPTAQDAHEAIRPTAAKRTPDSLKGILNKEQWALYDLIWRRFLASQMASALYEKTRVAIQCFEFRVSGFEDAEARSLQPVAQFGANGSRLLFPGFLTIEERDDEDKLLPPLKKGQALELIELKPEQHFTEPPPRFNEASLVKALEENGIGRPSTYAPTLATLRRRDYVRLERRSFRPTSLGFAVNDFLVENFPDVVNVEFTANMEAGLDKVERGSLEWRRVLSDFYHTFEPLVKTAKEFPKMEEKCPQCGQPLALRSGKYGRFYGCTGYPECKYIQPLHPRQPVVIVEGRTCPQCDKPLALRKGKFGTFVGCTGYPECTYIERKGKSSSKPEATGMACPVEGCGGSLVRRKGRRGYFYGCSNYPDCRFTSGEPPTSDNEPQAARRQTATTRTTRTKKGNMT